MKQYLYIITLVSIFLFPYQIKLLSQNSLLGFSVAYETANYTNNQYKNYLPRGENSTPSVKLGLDFNFNKFISIGGYINYTRFGIPLQSTSTYINNGIEQQITIFGFQESNALTLGTKIYFKLLPLFIKERDLKVDIYSTAQFALLYNSTNNNPFVKTGLIPEFGIGLGLGYSITKRLKIFGEYTIGKFYNDKNSRWTLGLRYSL